MTETKVTQKETRKQALIDDITLPLNVLEDFMRTVDLSNEHKYSWPSIAEMLIDNASRNLQEIVKALEARLGEIKIEHEHCGVDERRYHWGKIVGVIVNGEATGGEV